MIVHRTTSRRNGLQPPFNRYQIIGWILFVTELATTILVFIPPLEAAVRVIILPFPTSLPIFPGHLWSSLGSIVMLIFNICFSQ